MKQWTTTATASTCGHAYDVINAINDEGEHVTMHTACPNPDDPASAWDANDLCPACYESAMDKHMQNYTAADMLRAFSGGVLNI